MIDLFTPKIISPDCRFKSSQRQVKISILTPRCVAHHWDHFCGVLHTAEIISAVCCTPLRSSPRYDATCTPQRLSARFVAHRWDPLCSVHGDRLRSVQYTAEIISAVCYKPRRFFRNVMPLTTQCVAHRGDSWSWSTSWSNVLAKSKPNSKIL